MDLSPRYRLDWPTHDWSLLMQAERETLHVMNPATVAAGWEWCAEHREWDMCHIASCVTISQGEWGPIHDGD